MSTTIFHVGQTLTLRDTVAISPGNYPEYEVTIKDVTGGKHVLLTVNKIYIIPVDEKGITK